MTDNYVRPSLPEELSEIVYADNEGIFLNVNAVNNFILNFIIRYQDIENDSEVDDIIDQVYAAIFLNAVGVINIEVIEHIYEISPNVILVANEVIQIALTINDYLELGTKKGELKKIKVPYDDGKENKYLRYDDDSDDDNIGEMLFSYAEENKENEAKVIFKIGGYDSELLNDCFSTLTILSSVISFSFVGSLIECAALDEVISYY